MAAMLPRRGASRTADASRWVRDLLRSELHRGSFPGGRLPAEDALMQRYRVSRAGVRAALAALRAEGVIDRIQGIGTLIVNNVDSMTLDEAQGVAPPHPSGPLAGLSQPQILDHAELVLPEQVAERLEVPAGSRGVRVDYVSYFRGEPAWVATNYVRMPEGAQLDPSRFRTDFYAYLTDCGLGTAETTYLMTATLADELDAPLLGVATGTPILAGEQTIFNEAGEPFDFALVRLRGDRYSILTRARRAASGDADDGVPAAQVLVRAADHRSR